MKQQKMSDGELIEKVGKNVAKGGENVEEGKKVEKLFFFNISKQLDKHHVAVHIAQCSSCRFANKLWQKCFWDNFSNYNKTKAATGDKKKKKTKELFGLFKKWH
jgi:hypothetical protein